MTDNLGGVGTATAGLTVGSLASVLAIAGSPAGGAPAAGQAAANTVFVAIPNAPTGGTAGAAVQLNGVATPTTGAAVTSYSWSVTKDGKAYALPSGTSTNTANLNFTPSAAGFYARSR